EETEGVGQGAVEVEHRQVVAAAGTGGCGGDGRHAAGAGGGKDAILPGPARPVPVPSFTLDFLQRHLEAARVAPFPADPRHLRVGRVGGAVDRAGDLAVLPGAHLAQAVAGLATAAVGRVVHGRLARVQVDLGVVDHAADEQAPDHGAP